MHLYIYFTEDFYAYCLLNCSQMLFIDRLNFRERYEKKLKLNSHS